MLASEQGHPGTGQRAQTPGAPGGAAGEAFEAWAGASAPGLRIPEQAGLVGSLVAWARGARMGWVERLVSARRALAALEAGVREAQAA